MVQFLVEDAENQTAKNGICLTLHSGKNRKQCYLWETPETVKLDMLKHKIVEFVKIEDKGKYYSADWTDMVVLKHENVDPNSPLLKIKLKGEVNSKQLLQDYY